MTMPELRRWFEFLSARLRHVRIMQGDYKRALTGSTTLTLPCRMGGKGVCGVLLDPPYSAAAKRSKVYANDDFDVAVEVRAWALQTGDNPKYRIVLCGFEGEGHEELEEHGWRCIEWYKKGFLSGGMANSGGAGGSQMNRDRLWLSPHCLNPEAEKSVLDLFM